MPTLRLRDSLSERSITSRCLPAMAPRVLAMRGEVRSRPAGQSLQQLFRSQPVIRLEHSITPPWKTRTRPYSTSNKTFSILICGQLARRWRKPPSCGKLHQRLAPPSFAVLPTSVPQRFSSLNTIAKSAPFPVR